MPFYPYRCLSCKTVQTLFQEMREVLAPPCPDCGGLTERHFADAPRVLNFSQEPATPPDSAPDTHECGSACYLHHSKSSRPLR